MPPYRVGVDVGGTFTDLVILDEASGEFRSAKLLTNHEDIASTVIHAMLSSLRFRTDRLNDVTHVIHATTVASNSILSGELPKVALVTTKGFKDIIEIGRQRRPELYNLFFKRPRQLVPRELRLEVEERVGPRGVVIRDLDEESVREAANRIYEARVRAVAVCLLHSYANPSHEKRVKEILSRYVKDAYISLSSEVAPEFREYERASTTVINAILLPLMSSYLKKISETIRNYSDRARFWIMQSNGGLTGIEEAAARPFTTIESGPAAGVVATAYLTRLLDEDNAISFDMGGTTAKASLVVKGEPGLTSYYEVGGIVQSGRLVRGSGHPLISQFVDIAEVSAGGGTVAWVDEGGMLRVGPKSAGSNPGPACYGLGGKEPTVTDANLVLRRLPEAIAGGRVKLSLKLAEESVASLAKKLGGDLITTAHAVIKLANVIMAKALRIVSVERGYDPGDFVMVAFGGAGPMHALALAEDLGIKEVIIPTDPGMFSAIGLLVSDLVSWKSRSVIGIEDYKVIEKIYEEMENEIMEDYGRCNDKLLLERFADLRYKGQSYEITIRFTGILNTIESFHERHRQIYGYYDRSCDVEFVTLRVKVVKLLKKTSFKRLKHRGELNPKDALLYTKEVYFEDEGNFYRCNVFNRKMLLAGDKIVGPALIEEPSSTTVIHPEWVGTVDDYGNIRVKKD